MDAAETLAPDVGTAAACRAMGVARRPCTDAGDRGILSETADELGIFGQRWFESGQPPFSISLIRVAV